MNNKIVLQKREKVKLDYRDNYKDTKIFSTGILRDWKKFFFFVSYLPIGRQVFYFLSSFSCLPSGRQSLLNFSFFLTGTLKRLVRGSRKK